MFVMFELFLYKNDAEFYLHVDVQMIELFRAELFRIEIQYVDEVGYCLHSTIGD